MSTFTDKTTTPWQRLNQVAERWRISLADAEDLINVVDAAQSEPRHPVCTEAAAPICTKTTALCTEATAPICTEAAVPICTKTTALCTEATAPVCTEAAAPICTKTTALCTEATAPVCSCKDLMQAKVAAAFHPCDLRPQPLKRWPTYYISHDVGHNCSVFKASDTVGVDTPPPVSA